MLASKHTSAAIAHALACAIVCLCLSLACLCLLPRNAQADVKKTDLITGVSVDSRGLGISSCPSIDATAACAVGKDGTVYFQRSSDEQRKIASMTKIMTAVVALEHASLDMKITVSEKAAEIGESSAGLQAGDTMTLQTALLALMVPSGNDAAQAIAECVGAQMSGTDSSSQDAYNAFISAMNDTAASLGMTNTYYANPHGLDDGEYEDNHHSTAYDQCLLVQHAMQIADFRSSVNNDGVTITVDRDGVATSITLETTDLFLSDYEGACGVKTGHTDAAGSCFAAAVNRNGQEYYAVVLNSSSDYQRFYDCENLFDWIFEHTVSYKLLSGNSSIVIDGKTTPVIGYCAAADWTDKTFACTLENPDQAITVFNLSGNISQQVSFNEVTGDVHAGDVVGTVTYTQRNNIIATYSVVAAEDCAAPGILDRIGIFFSRLTSFITGSQKVATSVATNEMTLLNNKAA